MRRESSKINSVDLKKRLTKFSIFFLKIRRPPPRENPRSAPAISQDFCILICDSENNNLWECHMVSFVCRTTHELHSKNTKNVLQRVSSTQVVSIFGPSKIAEPTRIVKTKFFELNWAFHIAANVSITEMNVLIWRMNFLNSYFFL